MEQQLNSIQTQLYHIQDQPTRIVRLLNNNNNNRLPDQQTILDEFAERCREALESYRIEFERSGRQTPVRRRSEEGKDECIVSCATGCGKTSFVLRLLNDVDTMIAPPPDKTVYYFTEYQSIFDRYLHVTFRQGVPKSDEIEDMHDALVILDDMMTEADQKILNIFTRGSHHREISVIFMAVSYTHLTLPTKRIV